jgi:hypothetical protein
MPNRLGYDIVNSAFEEGSDILVAVIALRGRKVY